MMRDCAENLVSPATTILETLRIIDKHGVPIGLVHENGRLLGTVTDGDIRRGLLAGIGLDAPVSSVMNKAPITIPSGMSDDEALHLMRRQSVLYLPAVDAQGRLLGLKVLKDLEPASAPNPVVLMAGGLGLRLRPETEKIPKPMLEVGGKPILEHIIMRLVAQGFCDIRVAVNYMKERIEQHFETGAKWGARISYLQESTPLGTAGALSLIEEPGQHPIIVMNGDLVTNVNVEHLVKFHEEQDAPATMGAAVHRYSIRFGVLKIEGAELRDIEEKPIRSDYINAGIYVVAPRVLSLIPKGRSFDMPELFRELLNRAQQGLDSYPAIFPLREDWIDVGVRADLETVQGGQPPREK